jgi:hypothetical protein
VSPGGSVAKILHLPDRSIGCLLSVIKNRDHPVALSCTSVTAQKKSPWPTTCPCPPPSADHRWHSQRNFFAVSELLLVARWPSFVASDSQLVAPQAATRSNTMPPWQHHTTTLPAGPPSHGSVTPPCWQQVCRVMTAPCHHAGSSATVPWQHLACMLAVPPSFPRSSRRLSPQQNEAPTEAPPASPLHPQIVVVADSCMRAKSEVRRWKLQEAPSSERGARQRLEGEEWRWRIIVQHRHGGRREMAWELGGEKAVGERMTGGEMSRGDKVPGGPLYTASFSH